ncbi:MAG: ATP-binding protein [Desulfuromonadaceae bacterium]
MSQTASDVNDVVSLNPTTANLINVSLALEAAEVAMGRRSHLPGMVTFTGFSGLGKSLAVSYVAQQYRGFYIEFMDHWSKLDLIKMIMFVMGLKKLKGMGENDCVQAIISELAVCGRPLILDEFDQLIDRKHIASSLMALILNIAKKSGGSIILVGEELLPHKIANYEKFDNCVYARYLALPSEITDSRIMARHYYPELEIRDDLLELTVRKCRGITRRICINLDTFAAEAAALGIDSIGLAEWGTKQINTGEALKPRSLK